MHTSRFHIRAALLRVLILLIIIAAFIPSRSIAQATVSFTLPIGWNYARAIQITEQSGTTLTDYQVSLTIDTATLINTGQMQADGSDIRFSTTISGTEFLPYWIEYGSIGINTATTKIWVNLATLPAANTTTIYMFYGNPSATAASTMTTFDGPYSSTDQVNVNNTSLFPGTQRSFRFSPNQDVLVARLGKRVPNG